MKDEFLITLTPDQLMNFVNNGVERKELFETMIEINTEVESLKNEIIALRSLLETQ